MAPDKIYCESCSDGIYSHIDKWENADNIEYIRKDALMEWTKRLKERWEEPPMSKDSPGCVFILGQVIEKLNSM